MYLNIPSINTNKRCAGGVICRVSRLAALADDAAEPGPALVEALRDDGSAFYRARAPSQGDDPAGRGPSAALRRKGRRQRAGDPGAGGVRGCAALGVRGPSRALAGGDRRLRERRRLPHGAHRVRPGVRAGRAADRA